MNKKNKILLILFFTLLISVCFLLENKNNIDLKNEEKKSIFLNTNENINFENKTDNSQYEVTNISELENSSNKTESEPIKSQEEINSYWEDYTRPDTWSSMTQKYTLAYSLKNDKYDNNIDYITDTDSIISSNLSGLTTGVYITKSSRNMINNLLKSEVSDKFYIEENGLLKYNNSKYEINSPIEKLIVNTINNQNNLYILDLSFAYIDEEQGTTPYTMPIELNYLQFDIDEKKELLVYNIYNFQLETFLEGIQQLTGEILETN